MTRGERAEKLFLEGYNCAQSVVMAFADVLGANEDTLMAASLPLGGGLGRLRETCGAISGGAIVLGLLFPACDKAAMYALVQEFAGRFRERHATVSCGTLLRNAGLPAETAPTPEERTEEYYRRRPCPHVIRDAAAILEAMCRERGRLPRHDR